MKILIIAPLTDLSQRVEKYIPLDIINWGRSPVEIESKYSFLAEKTYLKQDKHDVKVLVLIPSKLRDKQNITFNTYEELLNKLYSLFRDQEIEKIDVIPFEDTVNLGTSLFFSYVSIYKTLRETLPNLILLDISHAESAFSSLVQQSLEVAMNDILLTYSEKMYFGIISSKDTGEIQTISHFVKDVNSVSLFQYLLRELKIFRTEKQVKLPQIMGRSEIKKFAFSITNCFPLLALHSIEDVKDLMSEEEFEKFLMSNMQIKDGKIYFDVELLEGATYYVLGVHLINRYRAKNPYSIENLRNILTISPLPCRRIGNEILDDLLASINYLLKNVKISGEYSLSSISSLLRLTVGEIAREKENILDLIRRHKKDCSDEVNLNGLGLDPNSTIINIEDKITIYYSSECIDKIMGKIRDFLNE
ncbi:hypothetical protein BFU36_09330 [Sulfolobus sp. A20]|uniref:TM1812 family CRISPR-associated protein n=1 Tax=Saccharolobus sp. A20 TaxID=1891280 RepID=UPI0008461443|nr:TM1812 family CRISPR-associated protein [Sulfolobus sp. A20]TRM74924.1 hypothetical protein DJ523_03865 [Sulfolobus sp. E5]TRM78733.1 hypothetical protein DJ532_00260 [Sulfolobus sp. A20-N-F8]TRM82307.1 hypothetical protein DJ531_09635 [Sulfolobus sp. A20-N-F6]TRM85506.1 hypothetical protein DJ522_00495 [Sulfolobus sp. F3]TRM95526.1 hypothetical protein DJ526_00085 [Sulfolobus sp. A20-N-G8]TRN01407.1 hypothetical protein DJ530_05905 [Sulfolobus sp. E1]